jgi:hypothetical protein
MSYSRLILIFCFCITILSFSSTSHGSDWKFFYQVRDYNPKGNESLNYYYDNESIVKPLRGIIQVWFKTTLGKDDASDSLVGKDGSDEAEQYRGHVEIECKSKSYRLLEETKLDSVETEKEVQKSPSGKPFHRVPLGSAMGTLWSNLCEYYY